jgi:hypothetical protein
MGGKSDIVERALKLVAGAEPQKTAKAYKLFRQKDGKLYPLFVDANEEVPLNQWLKAKAGEQAASGQVKSKAGPLAYRPGWHAGDLPIATHIGAKSHGNKRLPPDTRRSDEVWAEVEMADDVDWQKTADERARITKKGTPDPKTAHITDQVPYGGFYRYKTSPTMQGNWMIGGDMRVNRVLTDDEVRAINEAAGVSDLPRREGYGGGGEIVERALKLIAGTGPEVTPSGIRAYHGSPYRFDKFKWSPETRGMGEGNQSFGDGLYFAGKEDIAKWYKDKLAYANLRDKFEEELPRNADFDEVEALIGTGHFTPEQERLLGELKNNDWLGFDYPAQAITAATKDLSAYDPTPSLRDAVDRLGHMYEVDIATDPARLMDWNDKLKDQSGDVRSALMPFAESEADFANKARREALARGKDAFGRPYKEDRLERMRQVADPTEFNGAQVYSLLQRHFGAVRPGEKAAEASQYLLDKGLSGIQFLDASSRAPGIIEPTKNFVIPDDRLVTVRRRYDEGGEVGQQQPMAFVEDAKGTRYDIAGNVIPPQEQAISDALTTARAETYDPYAQEVASAKRLMADQAQQNQSWGDWASDVGSNLYNSGMALLPAALGGKGEVGLTDIAKGVYESGKSAVALPGDVLSGQTKVFDPASGNLTDEVLRRGMDFTGFMTLGAGAIPAEANTLRMGAKGIPEAPEPTQRPDMPSAQPVENAALKAAQSATGDDQAATAARLAREQGVDDSMAALQTAPAIPLDAPTKAFVQFGKPIPPTTPLPGPQLVSSAQADTRMGADIVKRRLPVIVPEQERVVGGVYTPGAPDGRRWSELTPQELAARGAGAKFTDDDLQTIWNQTLAEVSEAGRQAVANTGATWSVFPAEQWDKALKLPLRSQLWYELSGEAFVDRLPDLKYNEHMMFLDLVGATSARARPGENLERALGVLSQRLRGVPVDVDVTIPSTVSAALKRDGKNVSSDLANKTGMFSDTLALTGGLPVRYPISVNDVWVGKAFGITDDQLSSNQALHEVFGKYTNKLRDLVNKTSPGQYPHQSWNLQARQWVELRAADEGIDTSLPVSVDGSDYAGEWDKIAAKLERAGIALPGGRITRDVLLDPRFADALRPTTPGFRAAPKATVEFGTLLTPNGQKAAQLYERARQAGDQNTQDEYLAALTTAMYRTARGKPTLWEETARAALGDTTSVTRIYSPTTDDPFAISGTFGGAAAPNIRVPLRNLTPDQIAYFNAMAGNGLRQKAMAAVEIGRLEPGQPLPEGAVPSHAVRFDFDGPIPQRMLTDFASALGDGFEISVMRYPDGVVFDINPRFGDNGPEPASVKAVDSAINSLAATYGIRNPKVFDISYKSEYGKNYVEDPGDGTGYKRIINDTLKAWEADAVAQLQSVTQGKFSDAVLKKFLKGNDAALTDAAKAGGFAVSGLTGRAKTIRKVFQQRLGDHADLVRQWKAVGKEVDDNLGALIPKWERRYAKAEQKSIKEAPQRAVEQGFTTEAYRGSNRDIQEYGPRASESGYYGGKPTYFTSSSEDASGYTRVPVEEFDVSPYDQLKALQETNPDATLQDVLSGKYPNLAEDYVNRQRLGGENLGTVYPSKLRMSNPVRVGGENETVFTGDQAIGLVKAAAGVLADADVPEAASIVILSKLDEMAQAGSFGAMDFDLAVRNVARAADKRLGAKIGSILADIYQKAGFDSIDLDASVFSDKRAGSYSYPAPSGSRHYMVFDPENIRGRFAKFGGIGPEGPAYMKAMGGAVDDEDIDNALRIARATGGRAGYAEAGSVPVMMEDAKGNKYDAQGNVIPSQNPGPNPARSDLTPEQVGMQAAQDPATYDALMERYAIPDRDIAEYEAMRTKVAQQPQDVRQMTHLGDRPTREMTVDMPLFGGEYSMGRAPYDVASGMQGAAQTAYDFKTTPAYFFPATAPFALGADVLESRLADDPTGFILNAALTPQGASAAKSALDMVRRNPKAIAAAVGAGSYLSPDEAQAGPERWFSKLFRAAEALPMEKMTGEQALAMLRKSAPQEEIKWTGLENFASNNPVTTKQALLDFIKRNQVQTQDVVLGGGGKPFRREDVVPDEEVKAQFRDQITAANRRLANAQKAVSYSKGEALQEASNELFTASNALKRIEQEVIDAQVAKMGGLGRATKYQSYATPGGEGYSETLVTLPERDIYTPFVDKMREETRKKLYDDAIAGGLNEKTATSLAEIADKLEPHQLAESLGKQDELQRVFERQNSQPAYKSPHWDDKNVIGHIRSQMLTATPPGANRPLKLFNVDEAQSDLAQSGRKSGFKDTSRDWKKSYTDLVSRNTNDWVSMKAERAFEKNPAVYDNSIYVAMDAARMAAKVTGARRIADELGRGAEYDDMFSKMNAYNEGLPPAPYVTSTQGWTDFSIKKALDQAIDSGADYFTFTPGEVQAARYDLSKHIDTLSYNPNTGSLGAWDDEGRRVIDESILDEAELDNYVGKELAEKLRTQVNGLPVDEDTLKKNGYAKLSGLDLKVGGEGMIDYYNNIYKKRVEKVVKDLTGKKVQWEVLPAETAEGIVPRLGFRIDDDLREAKFPTFASGGTVSRALELTRDY